MTITPTYPGVYITEVGSGTRTIAGVATSITAFIGRALRGPVGEAVSISSFADFERSFGPLWRQSGLGYAVRDFYLNGGGPALVVRVVKDAATTRVNVDGLELAALGPGLWASQLGAHVGYPNDADAEAVAQAQGVSKTDLFSLTVFMGKATTDAAGNTRIDATEQEEYHNVTVVDGPRRIDRVLDSSRLARIEALSVPAARPAAQTYDTATTVGTDGDLPDLDAYRKGIAALETVDLVNLLVIPPVTPDKDVDHGVWQTAMQFAETRRAFLIVDPPATELPVDVKAWATGPAGLIGPGARNAAVYTPRIRAADPLSDGAVVAASAAGAIAGIYARTDATRGVWKAPAGIEAGIVGALAPAKVLTNDAQGPLNQQGVNVIRTFPDTGTVLWGARTLRGADTLADDYKYVPVRRLALYIEESLFRGTQWVVFEPNDEPLWAQIRLSVGAFMQDLFRRGALQGASPRAAYFVRCSADTTTQYDIDRGIVNIQVGFAPLKPAEFVMISIQQKTAQE